MIGSTQMRWAATIVENMDAGNGFVDRFIISIPKSLRTTPESAHEAHNQHATSNVTVGKMYAKLHSSLDKANPMEIYFADDAQRFVQFVIFPKYISD